MVCFAGYVQAADTVSVMGVPNTDGVYPLMVDTDRMVKLNGGFVKTYEAVTTSDTITAVESGKTFLVNPANAGVTFTLPDADVGLSYTFVQTVGDAAGNKKFILNTKDTDTIRAGVNGTSTSTFAAGDSIITPGATGDSITIFCGADTYWTVVNRTGTFVDNN
jgi:hypothetical protein